MTQDEDATNGRGGRRRGSKSGGGLADLDDFGMVGLESHCDDLDDMDPLSTERQRRKQVKMLILY